MALDSSTVPAWALQVLTSIDRDQKLEWTTVWQSTGTRRMRGRIDAGIGFRTFEAVDARRHRTQIDDALSSCDATALVGTRTLLDIETEHSDGSPAPARRTSPQLDAALDLRARPELAALTSLAGCAVWWAGPVFDHHVGDDAIFWSIHARRSVCEVLVLVQHSGRADADVVATAIVGIQPASIVVSRSLCYWKAAKLLVEQLTRRHDELGSEPTHASRQCEVAQPPTGPPRTSAVARVAVRQVIAGARHRVGNRTTRDQWILGFRNRSTAQPLFEGTGFEPVLPPPDRTWADPFLVEHGSTTLLFLEEYEFARGRGAISITTIGRDGPEGAPEVVLERPYHLSYPFVFRDAGEFFMIPETASNRTIELYRSTDFPGGWYPEAVLFEDVRALDSTLVVADDRYWLFTCVEEQGRNRHDELHVFSSAALQGPWEAHRQNPVVSDVRSARPAGRPFWMGGALIRPAQDCSGRYGSAIVFRRIRTLTQDDYEEEAAGDLPATWAPGLLATHTFATQGRCDVVDGLRRIPSR